MPQAAMRPCAGNCGARVLRGYCTSCARQDRIRRGSAHSRGYTSAWQRFRRQFIAELLDSDIAPVCGARMSDGPTAEHSQCIASGLRNGADLHLDHEPPLRDDERKNPRAVMDMRRIVLLCARCHNAKTAKAMTCH